jgi:DNA primase
LPLSDFLLRQLREGVNLQSSEGRVQFLESAKPLVIQIRASRLGRELRRRVAAEVGLSEAELNRDYGVRIAGAGPVAIARSARRAPSLTRRLLKCLVADPTLAKTIGLVGPQEPTAEADAIPEIINLVRSARNEMTHGQILQALRDTPHEPLVREIQSEILAEWGDDFDLAAEFQDVMHRLEELERDRQIEALLRKSEREAWTAEDKALYRQLTAARG